MLLNESIEKAKNLCNGTEIKKVYATNYNRLRFDINMHFAIVCLLLLFLTTLSSSFETNTRHSVECGFCKLC